LIGSILLACPRVDQESSSSQVDLVDAAAEDATVQEPEGSHAGEASEDLVGQEPKSSGSDQGEGAAEDRSSQEPEGSDEDISHEQEKETSNTAQNEETGADQVGLSHETGRPQLRGTILTTSVPSTTGAVQR